MKKILIITLSLGLLFGFSGCNWSNTAKGATIGTGAGAAAGAGIGALAGNTVLGAIIGAAVGGTTGALIGRSMDKQAEEIQNDLKGVTVERVGEGIRLTFDSGLLFNSGSSELSATSKTNIAQLSEILNKYEDTNILIEGHTDSDGSEELNQKLSEKRAEAVADYAKNNGVDNSRITIIGYGENQPIAENDTKEGKTKNRRVEMAIMANKKMKKLAEQGKL